jgi:hypothetical protein
MIRTVITPEQTDIRISVPPDYVGRKLEVTLNPVDELTDNAEKKTGAKKPSDFAGTLSKEKGEKFHEYLKQARNEWDRGF